MQEYIATYPDAKITYEGKGSSDGYANTVNGTYAFGCMSRELKPEEEIEGLTVNTIAMDGIAVIVHPDNPVTDLTMDQINQIYTGEITNWKEVGGPDEVISVVSRDAASGTREAFDDIMGFGGEGETPLSSTAIQLDSNGAVAQAVAGNTAAIGYISLDAVDESVKPISVEGVYPSEESIAAGDYGVARPFNLIYMEENLNETELEFLAWVEENEAELAHDMGLVPAND
jgi:phosphate transport system substrate-binding protein